MINLDNKTLEIGDLFVDNDAIYHVKKYNQNTDDYQVIKEDYDIVSEVSLSKNDLLDKTYVGHWLNPAFIEKPNDIIIY